MRNWGYLALAGLVLSSPALAEDWDFVVINNAGKDIKTIELAPAGTTSWQANKVDPEAGKTGAVKVGGRSSVHFDKGSSCKYDVKATFADSTSATWTGINVCDNSFVTLKAGGGAAFSAS